MWFEGTRLDSVRHECKREDDIRNWIWTEFDGDTYGKQRLTDVHNFVRLSMRYLKEGDNWIAEITGNSIKKSKAQRNITLIFYLGVTGDNSYIQLPKIHSKLVKYPFSLRYREHVVQYCFLLIPKTMETGIFALSKVHRRNLPSTSITLFQPCTLQHPN